MIQKLTLQEEDTLVSLSSTNMEELLTALLDHITYLKTQAQPSLYKIGDVMYSEELTEEQQEICDKINTAESLYYRLK